MADTEVKIDEQVTEQATVVKESKPNQKPRPHVNTEDKLLWTVREAAAYTGIGEPRIRSLAKADDCPFSLRVGRKISIKRKEFEEYLSNVKSV